MDEVAERFAETVWSDIIETAEAIVLGARALPEDARFAMRGAVQNLRRLDGPDVTWPSIRDEVAGRPTSRAAVEQEAWAATERLGELLKAMNAAFRELVALQHTIATAAATIAEERGFEPEDPSATRDNPACAPPSVLARLPFAEELRIRFLACR